MDYMVKRSATPIGTKVGRLTATGDAPDVVDAGAGQVRRRRQVAVRCDCGKESVVDFYSWKRGGTRSCGCLDEETRHLRHRTHGMHGTGIYGSWSAMKSRTTEGTVAQSSRGGYIGVCRDPRWDTFEGFLANQPAGRPWFRGAHLARFGDEGDYTPDNCRWATPSENRSEMLARRKLRLPDGRFAADVARENGIPVATWEQRYYQKGVAIEDAVTIRNLRRQP